MEETKKRTLGLGFLAVGVMHVIIALVASLKKDPNAPVTWREMMIVLVIQAVIFILLGIKLLWFNYAYFG